MDWEISAAIDGFDVGDWATILRIHTAHDVVPSTTRSYAAAAFGGDCSEFRRAVLEGDASSAFLCWTIPMFPDVTGQRARTASRHASHAVSGTRYCGVSTGQ